MKKETYYTIRPLVFNWHGQTRIAIGLHHNYRITKEDVLYRLSIYHNVFDKCSLSNWYFTTVKRCRQEANEHQKERMLKFIKEVHGNPVPSS